MANQSKFFFLSVIALLLFIAASDKTEDVTERNKERNTEVTIVGEQFFINGFPAYDGRSWTTSYGESYSIEGLLMNARLVQGIFDDLNPQTRGQWVYPDTKEWDPDRNTSEFINAMPVWVEHGLLGFTINLQGGCPYGYCRNQPWDNTAFSSDGSLRDSFVNRLERILDRADELGMVVVLGYFYFGQDENLENEAAVINAVKNASNWVLEKDYKNVIIEINNECSVGAYVHDILKCDRVHELIQTAKEIEQDGRSLYVSTSLGGGAVPPENIVRVSDYVLLHGNGVRDPGRIVEMISEVREMEVYSTMPIVNNEDDQPWRVDEQGWTESGNNFVASVKNYASWGFFDFRLQEEHGDYNTGFQSIPVNWQLSSERKRKFFQLLAEITGSPGSPDVHMNWSAEHGKVSAEIRGERPNAPVERVELVVNNEVVASLETAPYDFEIDLIHEGEHWVKARAIYHNGEYEVIVESPYYQNPWWPYGGPGN
jgi:hypothetical protein